MSYCSVVFYRKVAPFGEELRTAQSVPSINKGSVGWAQSAAIPVLT